MRLKSDFGDYYDWAFGRDGPVFERVGGNTGPPKREQFRLLEQGGFSTPPHGLVPEVLDSWWEGEKTWVKHVVAYTDESAHCTEGKVVYGRDQFKTNPCMNCPGGDYYWRERSERDRLYCSAFVGSYHMAASRGGCSLRRLQIGPHVFWVEYRSTESWMSNYGDGECFVVGVEKDAGFHPFFRRPLFAIDFVLGREMYAVDLNYGPGVRGSGVEKILSGPEVVRAVTSWHEEFGNGD